MDPRIEAARYGVQLPVQRKPAPGVPAAGSSGAPRARGPAMGHGGPRPAGTFDAVFRRTLEGLTFSQHAQDRLRARGIALGPQEMGRLSTGVERAAAKGARDSLVLMDRVAFIVSVKNRTVITALDGERLQSSVFTNIDSAVIV